MAAAASGDLPAPSDPEYLHVMAGLAQEEMPLRASPDAIARLPEAVARRHQVCPVAQLQGHLVLACTTIRGPRAQQELRLAAGLPIRLVQVEPPRVQQALDLHYGSRVTWQPPSGNEETDTTTLVDEILAQATRLGASDVHIAPTPAGLSVRYRVDGVLRPAPLLPGRAAPEVLARIKVLAGLDIVERHRPQDGRLTGPGGTPVRVSTVQTLHGEKAVLRLPGRADLQCLDSLGLLPEQVRTWRQALDRPHGLLLVAGPTGAGKTSTLYASLQALDRTARHVVSLEEPVERPVEGVSQIPLSVRAGADWAAGLRAVLRQDPDVIAVGEIRDASTATAAVQAALTGHLVLATVHAATAPGAIYRLIDLGVAPWMAAEAISHVLAQRLVRRVCGRCRKPVAPAAAELDYWRAWMREPPPDRLVAGQGCPACQGSGYFARMAVAEVLAVSEKIRPVISAGKPPPALSSRLKAEGWLPMQRAGCLAARAGATTLAELVRHVG